MRVARLLRFEWARDRDRIAVQFATSDIEWLRDQRGIPDEEQVVPSIRTDPQRTVCVGSRPPAASVRIAQAIRGRAPGVVSHAENEIDESFVVRQHDRETMGPSHRASHRFASAVS